MTEIKKKKPNGNDEAQRPQSGTSGEILHAARTQRGIGLEEISAAINIRVGQLRAIEEGNIDALPGMTYATGFVKSYAGFLKLNSAEIVQKFKAEHAVTSAAAQNLHFPEPIHEGPRPDIFIIGAAGFCIVLVLVAWAIFSGGDDKATKQAEQIPPAPAVGTMTGLTKTPPAPAGTVAGAHLLDSAAAPASVVLPPAPPVAAPAPAVTAPVVLPPTPEKTATAKDQEQPAAPIKIKSGKSRITLSARQAAWVEITDAQNHTVLEKVLRPGDHFFVPDQPGLKLVTSNAGGLIVTVDGSEVPPLGIRGEIVRGIALKAEELKATKSKARDDR